MQSLRETSGILKLIYLSLCQAVLYPIQIYNIVNLKGESHVKFPLAGRRFKPVIYV